MSTKRWLRRIGAAVASALIVGMAGMAAEVQAEQPGKVRRGGTARVGIFDTFPGFCVGQNPANSALMATRTMYEPLFEKTVGGDMIGVLATGATPSNDLKTWTVTLREGVTFHDGSPFNAAAVVANYQVNRGMAYLGAYAQGGKAAAATKLYTVGTAVPFLANMRNVVAESAYRVRFELDRAQNDLPAMLYASGRTFMRGLAQLSDANACSDNPIGTGAFKLVSWDSRTLKVVRNENYWRKDPNTGAQLPYLDAIEFSMVKEPNQRSAALRSNALDAAMFSSATDATFIRDLRLRRSVVTEYRSPQEYYPSLWFNQGKADSPFKSRNARLAVAHAIDRKAFVKVRGKGENEAADSIVGPRSVMYSKKGFAGYDLAKARRYAKAYAAETGKPLEFSMPSDTSTASMANVTLIKQMMQRAGITMRIESMETALILTKAFNTATGGNDHDAIFMLLMEGTDASFNLPFLVSNAWVADSTNPTAALKPTFGSLLSLSHHSSTSIDAQLFAGQAAPTKAQARAAYAKAVEQLQRDAVLTAVSRSYYSVFTTKKLQGIGKLQLQPGKTQRAVTNWGIDWTGVWKS